MAIIYEKNYNGQIIKINDTFSADPKETYTNQARTEYTISAEGAAQVYNTYWQDTRLYPMPNPWIVPSDGVAVNPVGSWVKALYFKVNISGMISLFIAGNNFYNTLLFHDLSGSGCPGGWNEWTTVDHSNLQCMFSTNIPIFEDEETALEYCNEPDETLRQNMIIENAVNYVSTDFGEETKYYFISNQRGQADVVRNTATATGSTTWRSIRFMTNSKPVLYFNDDYSLTLNARAVVASYSVSGPVYIIDNVPESSWQEGLAYDGPWYGDVMTRMEAKGETLPDGSYMYGFELSTNIYIYKDKAAADHAIETDDYSEAMNFADVAEGGTYNPPRFGYDEDETTSFGGGADTSPFMQTYVLSRNALIQVAQAWYNTTPATVKEILTGLELFGSVPHECLAGVTMYPFDVNRILNTAPQSYIYFGTYQMQMGATTLSKAMSLKSNAYLDCGTIFLASLQNSFKDFSPYTELDLFLPYIGWQRMDIRLLINKNINVRYYVDIHTRSCVACVLANGVFVAQFAGTIGVGLPVSSTDFQSFANSMGATILGGGSQIVTGAKGALSGALGIVGGGAAGTSILTSAMGIGAVAANTAATLNKLEAMGSPADHPTIKGGFTSGLGTYLPQQVLWRYTIHDTVEPNNFNELCGRPSSTGASIGSFSGYLSCKQVKLNTNNMLDAEAAEIYSLLKNGVYL